MTQLTERQSESREIPAPWIDRLFERFSMMYGKHWLDLWADVPTAKVKEAWREDLSGCTGEQIKRGLEHCKTACKFPPTLPEFVGICRSFRVDAAHRVFPALAAPSQRDIPDKIRTEIAKLFETQRKQDPKDWARKILRDAERGEYKLLIGIEMAKSALGV